MTVLTLRTKHDICKGDMVVLCKCLNDEFKGSCEFQPEGITEGGILYNFNDGTAGYKSVRLCIGMNGSGGKWYWINHDKDVAMREWVDNTDIIYTANTKFCISLKNLYGAPPFTIEELQIWEKCFNQIGIVKVGKYPSKKKLLNN